MKDDVLQFRLSTDDKIKIKEMAKESGLSLTDFIVSKCNDKCNDKECNDNCNDNGYLLNKFIEDLKLAEDKLNHFRERTYSLSAENKELRKQIQEPKLIEVDSFDKCSVSGRPNINVFVDWIGYSMFVKDLQFEKMDKEKQKIYHEVWDNHIKPMYKEFCEGFK